MATLAKIQRARYQRTYGAPMDQKRALRQVERRDPKTGEVLASTLVPTGFMDGRFIGRAQAGSQMRTEILDLLRGQGGNAPIDTGDLEKRVMDRIDHETDRQRKAMKKRFDDIVDQLSLMLDKAGKDQAAQLASDIVDINDQLRDYVDTRLLGEMTTLEDRLVIMINSLRAKITAISKVQGAPTGKPVGTPTARAAVVDVVNTVLDTVPGDDAVEKLGAFGAVATLSGGANPFDSIDDIDSWIDLMSSYINVATGDKRWTLLGGETGPADKNGAKPDKTGRKYLAAVLLRGLLNDQYSGSPGWTPLTTADKSSKVILLAALGLDRGQELTVSNTVTKKMANSFKTDIDHKFSVGLFVGLDLTKLDLTSLTSDQETEFLLEPLKSAFGEPLDTIYTNSISPDTDYDDSSLDLLILNAAAFSAGEETNRKKDVHDDAEQQLIDGTGSQKSVDEALNDLQDAEARSNDFKEQLKKIGKSAIDAAVTKDESRGGPGRSIVKFIETSAGFIKGIVASTMDEADALTYLQRMVWYTGLSRKIMKFMEDARATKKIELVQKVFVDDVVRTVFDAFLADAEHMGKYRDVTENFIKTAKKVLII